MAKDFYEILGLRRDAEPGRIRKAYRSEVKKCHPDASGSASSSRRFREVEQAYETLRDADRRQAYDRHLDRQAGGSRQSRQEGGSRGEGGRPPAAFAREPLRPYGEPLLEVLLSADEARYGITVPVEVPVWAPCPQCGQAGLWARLSCALCAGAAVVRCSRPVTLAKPAGVRHGEEFRCGAGPGFRVRVLVLHY